MDYSSCPACGTIIGEPARWFCPSCGGRLPGVTGDVRPAAPAAHPCRRNPATFSAVCLLLLVLAAAMAVPFLLQHPSPVPAAANGSALPSPAVTPEVPGYAGNTTAAPPPQADHNAPGNRSGSGLPVNTALTVPAPSRTPPFTGTVITLTGTPPSACQAPATGCSPGVPAINATTLAARVHDLVNRQRQEHGLAPLGTDMALASLARAHSTDMAAHGYFGHVNLQDWDATARGVAAGYTCHKTTDPYFTYAIAENIFATYRYSPVLLADGVKTGFAWSTEEEIANETVDAWMNSPDHRDNILATGMDREGIGVAISKDDLVFVTEDFC